MYLKEAQEVSRVDLFGASKKGRLADIIMRVSYYIEERIKHAYRDDEETAKSLISQISQTLDMDEDEYKKFLELADYVATPKLREETDGCDGVGIGSVESRDLSIKLIIDRTKVPEHMEFTSGDLLSMCEEFSALPDGCVADGGGNAEIHEGKIILNFEELMFEWQALVCYFIARNYTSSLVCSIEISPHDMEIGVPDMEYEDVQKMMAEENQQT